MNAGLVPSVLALLAFCVGAETVQQLGFKVGADRAGAAVGAGGGFMRAVAREPLIWLGVALWGLESIAWVLVLQTTPLSVAYPLMTLSYAAVPLAGALALGERMSRRQLAGAALIFGGVVCIAFSGFRP